MTRGRPPVLVETLCAAIAWCVVNGDPNLADDLDVLLARHLRRNRLKRESYRRRMAGEPKRCKHGEHRRAQWRDSKRRAA